jgi:ABC-type polar amino acid transport system ATPase subunit
MIEIKDIEKSFGGTKILKGISTIFWNRKTNLIIGQSGSGKTVLLKVFRESIPRMERFVLMGECILN